VFVPVFAVACLASLSYVFLRPPVYVSIARLQIEPPRSQRVEGEGPMLTAAQALTSSAVLDDVVQQVSRSSPGAAGAIGSSDALRNMLSATPVPGTNVIELHAESDRREWLPLVLDAWIQSYRRSQTDAHDKSSTAALDEARDSVQQLKQELAEKRRDLDQYRKKADIVSLEREENQAAARLRGLNTSLNDARTKEVNAEARVNAMRDNLAAGKAVVERGDRAIIAELERRAIDLREKMKDFEAEYTAPYLALDAKYKALRTNLTRLEQQIERERRVSAEQAVQSAEEELTSARQAVLRIQHELAVRKREVQEFTSRFAEHSALVGELKRLEESFDVARQRLSQLESERKIAAAGPMVTVLSQPSVPDRPARPDYWRDALIAVAGSGMLGLLAVWFIEFFHRSAVPPPELMQQPVIHIAYAPNPMLDATIPVLGGSLPRLTEATTVTQFPRELTGPEVHALWSAASPDARLVIAGLFAGMTLEELPELRYESIDFDAGRVYLGGSNRSAALLEPVRRLLKDRQSQHGAGRVLAGAQGAPLSLADLEGLIACAACDAGLAAPTEVNSRVLRHTYLAYLVRQGARLADIGGLIGYVAPADFREYGRLSPSGPGLPLEQIDPIFPALR
jgi:polysaccharide biosynthesis transport protein